MYRGVPLTLVVSALLALAPAAEAATRYAGPNGSMTVGCTDHDQPCDIASTFSQAQANDEVIIEAGDYGSPGAPLGTPIVSTTAGLDVHGEDGKARPRIFGATAANNTSVLDLSGLGVKLRNIEIHQLGAAVHPTALTFDGTQASNLIAISPGSGGRGCVLLRNSLLTNSVCETDGTDGVAVFPYRDTGSPAANTSTLRNVTALAPGTRGLGIEAIGGNTASDAQNITVSNTIVVVPSSQPAILAFKQTADATITIDHSNFGFQGTDPGRGGQFVKGPGNQQLVGAPKFVAAGDYHIAAGSITIDKGADDPANGTTDIDGDARTLGQATDMGADEFVPPPVVTTGGASNVTKSSADVSGAVNPELLAATYHFEYGTTTAYGASTPTADAGAGTANVPVTATLTGLAPGTTYHYRLVATNAGGTTPGSDMTFATQSAPGGGGGGGTGAGPHFIGPLKLAAKVTFTLDRAATVRFTVERATAGRRSGKRCVKPTKKNRKAKRCTRYVRLKGRLDRVSTAGTNSFKFTRRWNGKKLAVGRYRLVAAALNAAGKTSDTRRASFKIVKH